MNQSMTVFLKNVRNTYIGISKNVREYVRGRRPYIRRGRYGIDYFINPGSALDHHIVRRGVMGDWLAQQTEQFLPEDGIVLDIGANIGLLTTVFAKHYVPKGRVYAYEPDLQNVSQLKTTIDLNQFRHVHVLPIALQDDPNLLQATLHIRRTVDGDGMENRGLSSLLALPLHEVEEQLVLASTIDKEVQRLNIQRLDFIKIDVEGAEYEVLRGGAASISRFHPVIQYEYSNVIDEMAGLTNTVDCFSFLHELGYRQFAIQGEKNLQELTRPDSKIGDVNVLCFWGDIVPLRRRNESSL